LIISIAVSIVMFGIKGMSAVAAGMVVGVIMIFVGKHVFGGVNGDIFGATNEVARVVSLFVLVIM
jgi:adenosylcobinamide-GDP ribazoletransferase